MTGERRVVITGMGAVSPFGLSVDRLWEALIEGRSGIAPITLFDSTKFAVHFAGQCRDFDATQHLDRKLIKRLDRYAQFAMIAQGEACREAGLEPDQYDRLRIAVIFGSGIGGLTEIEQQIFRLIAKGPARVSAFTIPKLMVNAAASNISIALGAKGESIAVSSACASATNAMGEATRRIRHDLADVVVTGGAEAAITQLSFSGFSSMKALSTRNDEPERASRPFDRDRDGFVLSEGAGAFVFEELEHAKRRRAPILAEVIGFASSSDADHLTQPLASGAGAAVAMKAALADAKVDPGDVDYINAHATGTPLGDVAETCAIKSVFGPAASKLVISSTKGAMGHTLGASGGLELAVVVRSIQHSVIPPTANLDHPGEGCDLDYCPKTARDRNVRIAVNNSFGFGGHNACLVVRRFE